MTCYEVFRAQFTRARLPPHSLHDLDDPLTWVQVWGTSSVLNNRRDFVRFRLFLTLFITVVFIAAVVNSFMYCTTSSGGKYLIYLTNWTLTMETIYFWFALYTTVKANTFMDM